MGKKTKRATVSAIIIFLLIALAIFLAVYKNYKNEDASNGIALDDSVLSEVASEQTQNSDRPNQEQQKTNTSIDGWDALMEDDGVSYIQVYVYPPNEVIKEGDYAIMSKFKGDKEFGEYFWATAFGEAVPGSITIFYSQRSNPVSFGGVDYEYAPANLRIPGVDEYYEYSLWLVELYMDPNEDNQPTARFIKNMGNIESESDDIVKTIKASKKSDDTLSVEISFADQSEDKLTVEINKNK